LRNAGDYVNGDTEATEKTGQKTLLFGQFFSGSCLWKGGIELMGYQ